ncbi:MAG: branched-chain amino acid ABC transporter permease [Alphaproteobacteria bacterium]|nr:MAG: branched-chain amino acid ABC transporter permease [Alphaproteobacteria bacterium]
MIASLTPRNVVVAVLLLLLAAVPVYAAVTANAFLVTLFTRVIILGIAASSLNLILGYGGMVSFGHAVYLGIGGYAVGILAQEGVTSGFVQWPLALVVSALFALLVGALSLRTRGVYFIMITLAFAQLVYYFGVGLDRYGADDGLTIRRRSQILADRARTPVPAGRAVCTRRHRRPAGGSAPWLMHCSRSRN